MKPKTFMVIAGEASGDQLAAELGFMLRQELAQAEAVTTQDYQPLQTGLAPRFFGAGGPRMAAAGVELIFDLTRHSVIGISDVVRKYFQFRRLFYQLYRTALEREPDAIICVDFSGFNRRFAHAIRRYTRRRQECFHNWRPKIIQYVSPQVWASRESRIYQMERDYDLLLSIFPFEKEWYAKRVPALPVQFVGNSIVDRYAKVPPPGPSLADVPVSSPLVLLLPGSRHSELRRHLPVLVPALAHMRQRLPSLRARVVVPNEELAEVAKAWNLGEGCELRVGGLAESLQAATVALASTGTVTLECAWFGVPTVALYKTSWSTYQIGRRIVTVKFLAMPNLLAGEKIFPEFIQEAATPQAIARAALDLLTDESRRKAVRNKLAALRTPLGTPGASRRAAQAILRLLEIPSGDSVRPAPR